MAVAETPVDDVVGGHPLACRQPDHPCIHADLQFKDLQPGEGASIQGKIIFEGKLADFDFAKWTAIEQHEPLENPADTRDYPEASES